MTKLQEPHLTSNEDHHHGEAVAHYGGMGLVGVRSIQQGRPVRGVGQDCCRRV